MSDNFNDLDQSAKDGITKLEQFLSQTYDAFKEHELAGVIIAYAKGGAGGSFLCMDTPFSRISVHEKSGALLFGPFDPADLDREADIIEENVTMIRAMHKMVKEHYVNFKAQADKIEAMMGAMGIKTTLEQSGDITIPK